MWSGDIGSDFGSLHNQLFAGQGIGLSGIAMWTTDTGECGGWGARVASASPSSPPTHASSRPRTAGGYGWGGNATDPMFMELIVRW